MPPAISSFENRVGFLFRQAKQVVLYFRPTIVLAQKAKQLSSLLILLLVCNCPESFAATPRQLVSNSAGQLKNHTDKLVQQVQAFLQSTGRWSPPQGQDLQLCQALESFQKRVARLASDNNGASYDTVRKDLQDLEFQTQLLVPLLNQAGSNQPVMSAWMQCRSDILSVSQALSLVPGMNSNMFYDADAGMQASSFQTPAQAPLHSLPAAGQPESGMSGLNNMQTGMPPSAIPPQINRDLSGSVISQSAPGSPFDPGLRQTNIHITRNSSFDSPGFQPETSTFQFSEGSQNAGQNHFSSAVFSNLSGAENQTERFVKQLTLFLQGKGLWPPPQASTEMLLCQHLQSFQQQVRRFRGDLQSNLSYPVLQSEMQQIGSCSQSIDQLLMEIAAPADLTSRWNEVRTYMNSTYQSFLSAGSSGYIWMR